MTKRWRGRRAVWQVERIFRQSSEFCSEHDTWKLNVAHTFFMQDNKYKEAIRYYEPIVKKYQDSVLDLTAMVRWVRVRVRVKVRVFAFFLREHLKG